MTSHDFCSTIQHDVVPYIAGEESYVVLDKGAITDSHVLVLPIEHFPNSLHLSASTFAEMERYLSALRSCFASQVLPFMPVPSNARKQAAQWPTPSPQ